MQARRGGAAATATPRPSPARPAGREWPAPHKSPGAFGTPAGERQRAGPGPARRPLRCARRRRGKQRAPRKPLRGCWIARCPGTGGAFPPARSPAVFFPAARRAGPERCASSTRSRSLVAAGGGASPLRASRYDDSHKTYYGTSNMALQGRGIRIPINGLCDDLGPVRDRLVGERRSVSSRRCGWRLGRRRRCGTGSGAAGRARTR